MKEKYKKKFKAELADVINEYYQATGIKTEKQIYEDRCRRLEKARAVRALKLKAAREEKERKEYFQEEEKNKQARFLEEFKLLTVSDVATLLQISYTGVIKLLKSGQLPPINIGTKSKKIYRIDKDALYRFLKQCYIHDIDDTYTEEEISSLRNRKEVLSPKTSLKLIQPSRR